MLKNTVQIDYIIGSNTYTFICGNTSPLPEIKEALCYYMKYIGNIEDHAKSQQEAQASEQKEQAPDIAPPLEKAE